MAATQDGKTIYEAGRAILAKHWQGQRVGKIQVTALDPYYRMDQHDFFYVPDEKKEKLNQLQDQINAKYGEFTLAPATLIQRSDSPNVIPPAWKPYGHRESIGGK